jgi:hypothetical protein
MPGRMIRLTKSRTNGGRGRRPDPPAEDDVFLSPRLALLLRVTLFSQSVTVLFESLGPCGGDVVFAERDSSFRAPGPLVGVTLLSRSVTAVSEPPAISSRLALLLKVTLFSQSVTPVFDPSGAPAEVNPVSKNLPFSAHPEDTPIHVGLALRLIFLYSTRLAAGLVWRCGIYAGRRGFECPENAK